MTRCCLRDVFLVFVRSVFDFLDVSFGFRFFVFIGLALFVFFIVFFCW